MRPRFCWRKMAALTAMSALVLTSAASAREYAVYLYCNSPTHGVKPGGKWSFQGRFPDIASCDEARVAHKANHGIGGVPITVECSWRAPDEW